MDGSSILSAATCGSLSFWGYFNRGEHHMYAVRYIQVLLSTILIGTIFLNSVGKVSFFAALGFTSKLAFYFLFGLYSNLLFFRIFLNPLNKFPGPWTARIGKFDHVFRNSKFNAHLVHLREHEKYGSIVRIGPNDLSITDASATPMVSGPNSKCTKGPWYDQDSPFLSMHTTRDKAMHDRRRRIWAPAFSDKSLRGYEKRVQTINDLLVSKLDESKGSPINATNLLNLYSFDVMGDLAYGKTFDMLKDGKPHWAIQLLSEGMDPLGLQFPPWFFRLVVAIPGATKGYHQFIDFCVKQLEKRMAVQNKTDPDKPDIANFLIEHFNKAEKRDQKTLLPLIQADSRLIIVAGSDTTAATLTHIFYHLAHETKWQRAIRDELQKIKSANNIDSSTVPDQWLKDANVLNGVINETLRMNPPVPSGVFRRTPAEGLELCGRFVPGNTNIQMPQYAMSRSSENFERPNEFIPERFYSKPEMIKQKDAFAPFSTGPFGCIGKNLAYMEVRTITAQIVDQFDVSFAPGEDGQKLLTQTVDHFTLGMKELNLCFKRV